jgi:hypothetical protein
VWLLAALLLMAPLAGSSLCRVTCGAADDASLYQRDTTATVSRPELELRARPTKQLPEPSLDGALGIAHLAYFLPERPAPPPATAPDTIPRSRSTTVFSARSPPRRRTQIA